MRDSIKNLKTAIEELNVFTASEPSHLSLGENGRLVAVKSSLLRRIFGFARPLFGFSLSDQEHREQEMRIKQLKERIFRLREIIQTNFHLIESFQKGTESQRKFAAFALKTIERYNDIVVGQSHSKINKLSLFSKEHRRLFLDKEIKGHPIVSHQVKVGFNFPSSINPVQKMLKGLNEPLSPRESFSNGTSPIYKKTHQFIIDVFKVKARPMIQNKFSSHHRSSEDLVEGEIEMKEEKETNCVRIEQQIKDLASGSVFVLMASFQLPNRLESQFMPIPTLLELKWKEDRECLEIANEKNEANAL